MSATSSWRSRLAWAVVPRLVRLVGKVAWRLRIDRGEGFPRPPFVVAANHHSFLDPLLVGTAYGRPTRFLALVDLFGNYRWVDAALRVFDVIPVRRGTVPLGPVRTALAHLDGGDVIGVFPEGTRHHTFQPEQVRRGAAWLAVKAGVPLVPVAVVGSEHVLGVDNRLHRGRIRVKVGPAMVGRGEDREAVDRLIRAWADWVGEALTDREES